MKIKFRFTGLKIKIIFYIFVTTVIIFLLLFFYNYSIAKGIIEKDIEKNASNLSYRTINEIEKILLSISKVVDNTADYIENSNFSDKEITNFVQQLVEDNPEIYGSTFAFDEGKYKGQKFYAPYFYKDGQKISFKFLGSEDYNYFIFDWFQIPKELGKKIWSEPYFDEGGGNIIMSTYSVPVFRRTEKGKEFVGILTADISLNWLREIVDKIKIYETGYGFLISKTGVYITHPIKERVMNETVFSISESRNEPYLRDIGRKMISGEEGFAKIKSNINEKESYVFYAPIVLNDWSLALVIPIDELMSDVTLLGRVSFYIILIGVIILLIVISAISNSITNPLIKLADVANEIAGGKLEADVPKYKSNDEIGDLSKSFQFMQRQLIKTINDLKKANDELEQYSKTLEIKVEERTKELKEKNEALDKSFNTIKIISEIGQKITASLNLDSIFKTVYESINSLMEATTFLIMVHNEKENSLECKLAIEQNERLPEFSFSLSDKDRFGVWCFLNKQPIFMNDVENEYMKYISVRQSPKAGLTMCSIMYYPLIVEGKVIGTISVQSVNKNAYSQQHLDILSSIANYTAIALDNAFAYEKIKIANKELKEAQTQLIQAEKMASLGQLTAGIAHEIKNPLNFVNNFSEISIEFIDEINQELENNKEKIDKDSLENLEELLGDLQMNLKKINEHGKRADSIVKGMLLHSRGKSGEFQETDINSLLNEYVNLSYHGFRAQDASFNVKIVTEYDKTINKVKVVPQDLSRVFLNLINNACYSINEKSKEKLPGYVPTLTVISKNSGDKIEIIIRDNGKGIPKEALEKIFNPFYTTKPAGKGTGLGLSISYDIIVQEHKGQLLVNSEEGKFAEFVIILPKQ